jgi:spore germination protein KC
VFKEGFVITLENNVNEQVKREISNMIDTLQRKDSDVVLLGNAFYHENPEKWQNIKEDWLDIFPDIPVTVKVTSTIQCSYNLQSATGR